jgi:YfiH family protein
MIIKTDIFTHKTIKTLQTTRHGGISQKPYDSLNLNTFSEDKLAPENLLKLSKEQGLPHVPVFMQQVHTNKVTEYKQAPQTHGEVIADACFTTKPNIICAILTADCLPILISDKNASVVAAIHCGWRSLHADIIKQTLIKLAVNNADLYCWLGPCISYKPYRVDAAFREKFTLKDKQFAHCFYRNKKGGWHADLKKIAVTQLQASGVKFISQSPYCTHDNKSLFYSYRRDGETGRMASMIWLNQ